MPAVIQRCSAALLSLLVVVSAPATALAAPCWPPPVRAPVTDPFREPGCRWCPGNRGIEYGTEAGTPIRAIAGGTVSFAGSVAGTRYVVVTHADNRRLTYGNLRHVGVAEGDVVARGARLGEAAGRFHLGLRDRDRYVDPAPFLGEEHGVVRLVPTDGTAAAPAPPPRLVCPSS
jgi:murein DD-endopeptidase MepM/ murein hydrolase activator NlpD